MNKIIYRLISVVVSLSLTLGVYFSAGALPASTGNLLASKVVYVNSNGSDSNSGSAALPFKTLAKGVSVLLAGDTLNVTGKFNLPLTVSKSGTASSPINIVGKAAILNMNNAQQNGIKISGSYINISGFEVTGTTSHGVLISGKHIKFENSSIHHSVTENGTGTCNGTGSWGSALKIMVGAEDVTVRGNAVYENCGEGIGITRGINIMVENNTVRDNFSVNIYMDNSPYTTATNNTVICTGIYLRDGRRPTGITVAEEYYSGWGAQRHDNNVLNNRVDGCYEGITSWLPEPEVASGKLINAAISGNTVTNGIRRSIAVYSLNQNVLIENNNIYAAAYIVNSGGITLKNNTVIGSTPVPPTPTFVLTSTPASSTAVQTSIPATATPTKPILPTATPTSIPMTATPTMPILPTVTQTSIPMTATLTMPTATLPATNPPVSEIIYDDTNSAFLFSPNWQDIADTQAYGGSYKITSTYGASAKMDFIGQSFSILYTDGSTYRRMSVYVDGALAGTIYRATSTIKYQQRWDYPGQLSAGAHTIEMVFANGNGTFDAVIIR